jgi:hypothetical protein
MDGISLDAQVFYHLGEFNDALNYALCAGSLFDVADTTDYVQTLLGEPPSPPPPPIHVKTSLLRPVWHWEDVPSLLRS